MEQGWAPSQNTVWLMQSIGYTLQVVNGGISGIVHDPMVTLVIAAVVGGYQMYVQHLGIQVPSPAQTETMRILSDANKKG